MAFLPIARFAALCKQYGPGRLPYADRREIGAGYAMATTATVATVTFILVMQVPGLPEVLPTGDDAVYFGSIALPIVVPSAFVAGVIAWRSATPELSRFGPVAGLVATGVTYLFGSLAIGAVLMIRSLVQDPSQLRTLSAVGDLLIGVVASAPLVGAVAFLFTFWLTLPLGALGGSIYERARTASTPPS